MKGHKRISSPTKKGWESWTVQLKEEVVCIINVSTYLNRACQKERDRHFSADLWQDKYNRHKLKHKLKEALSEHQETLFYYESDQALAVSLDEMISRSLSNLNQPVILQTPRLVRES